MDILIEILAVIAAWVVLVLTFISLGRNAVRLGRAVKLMQEHGQAKAMALAAGSAAAQQRAFSISARADSLQRNVDSIQVSGGRLMTVIAAFQETSRRISALIARLGY